MILTGQQRNDEVYENIFVELSDEDATLFIGNTTIFVSRAIFERILFTMQVAMYEEEFEENNNGA